MKIGEVVWAEQSGKETSREESFNADLLITI